MRTPSPEVEDFLDCVELEELVAYFLTQSIAYMQDIAAEIEAQLENSITVEVTVKPGIPDGQEFFEIHMVNGMYISILLLGVHNPNKIEHIKVIRKYTGLGLKESKDIADTLHIAVKQNIPAVPIRISVLVQPGETHVDMLSAFRAAGLDVAVPAEWLMP